MSFLSQVPAEILTNIAIFLACDDPFLPPADLLALQATSHYFNVALNCHINPAVWTAAFRFRFDHQAVLRRNFRPNGRDYYDQLRQYTETLAVIRRQRASLSPGDDDFLEEAIRTVYVMLLDNNGKNRTQLESAGIDPFILHYLRHRLWVHADTNDGWPLDSADNAYVLWAMWMLTTLPKLQQETMAEREQIVTILLPYVINPYRYYQAEAPPSHFHLPLPDHFHFPRHIHPQPGFLVSAPSAHGPYPVYADPNRLVSLPYFGSMSTFTPPPIASAAKLLYFARREIIPFNIPPQMPRTRAEAPPTTEPRPVQEDLIEINAHRGAEPPPVVTWDWVQGCKLVNGIPHDSIADHSVFWDPDYWRRRLCGNAWLQNPKWRPGKVYVPGCMDGLWQGRLVFPQEADMRHLVEHAVYPSPKNFNEVALHITHQPLFMRLKELHAISTSSSATHLHVPFPPQYPQSNNDDSTVWSDLSMRNAWFPGELGNLQFITDSNPPRNSRLYTPPGQPKNVLVRLDGHSPPPGTYPSSPYTSESNTWLYKLFDRNLDQERQRAAVSEPETGYMHEGCDQCQTCREREEAVRRAKALDERDHEVVTDAYARDWRTIDQLFESVGLGRGETDPEDDMDDDDDDDDDGDGDITVEEEEIPEFLQDISAETVYPGIRPVRRGTDRAKIAECDGIKDIIFEGTTDRRHALAWNTYTFYGRVRPWDGLIGILRRSPGDPQFWPRQNFIFFYGYLVGGETFVGNWRFAAFEPSLPTWESAFVMSRRKDEDAREGNGKDGEI